MEQCPLRDPPRCRPTAASCLQALTLHLYNHQDWPYDVGDQLAGLFGDRNKEQLAEGAYLSAHFLAAQPEKHHVKQCKCRR